MRFCGTLLAVSVLAGAKASNVPDESAVIGHGHLLSPRGFDLYDSTTCQGDGSCAALSLIQRHALRTSQQDTGILKLSSKSQGTVKHSPTQERDSEQKAERSSKPHEAAASRNSMAAGPQQQSNYDEGGLTWRKQRCGHGWCDKPQPPVALVSKPRPKSALLDSVGPVPLGLLAMESHITSAHEVKLSGAAFILLILIILVVVVALYFLYYLVDERKDSLKRGASVSSPPTKSVAGDAFLLSSAGRIPGTQSTVSSNASWTQQRFSPMAPHLSLPVGQQRGDQSVLVFPLEAATQGNRGTYYVHWCDMSQPWFKLEIEGGGMTHKEQLRLYEVYGGRNTLCGIVNLALVSLTEGASSFIVDNSQLQARTNGLNMRTRKAMEDSSRSAVRVAAWGKIVNGTDCGDGWLQVNEGGKEYYLPMEVNGKRTVIPSGGAVQAAKDIDICNAAGAAFATFRWNMKEGRTYRYNFIRSGAKLADVQIPGSPGFLMEASQSGRKLAHIEAISDGSTSKPENLELLVEHMDPVVMLLGAVAMLRRLPPHG